MTTADDILTGTAPSPRPIASGFRLYLLLVVPLAVLEGAVTGGVQGGVEGAVNGGIYGVLIGPVFASWAWTIRRDRRRFWRRFLLGVALEAAGGLLIGLAARFLAFIPVWIFAAILAVATVMIVTSLEAVRREPRWAVRGAIAGAIAGAVAGLLGAILLSVVALQEGEPPVALLGLFLLGLCLPLDGALGGAVWGAALRYVVRVYRSAWIRARCRRRRADSLGDGSDPLDLTDLDLAFAAGPARARLTGLLLQALAGQAQALHFESLGAVCRVRQERDGAVGELAPLQVPALDLAREFFLFGDLTPTGPAAGWQGRLRLRLGKHAPDATVSVRPRGDGLEGSLLFAPGGPAVGEVLLALREYWELLGDCRERWLAPVAVPARPGAGPAADAIDGQRPGTRLRLVFEPPPLLKMPQPVRVEFDGQFLGVAPLALGFDYWVVVSPGNHLLRLDALHRWPWVGKDYLLQVAGPGVYEVRLRWHRWWSNFQARADVRPVETGGAAAPAPATG